MKKTCLLLPLILLFTIFTHKESYAINVLGLQPLAPNGVFSTFSAESLHIKNYSFEIGGERSTEPDFYRFYLKGAYGLTDSFELNVMLPYVYNYSDTIDGMEDISVGIKHRFYDEGKYGPALAYMINASVSSGANNFTTDGRFGLGFIVSKRIGPFRGHFNIFYENPGSSKLKDEISLAAGVELSVAHNFDMLGEIFAIKSHNSDVYKQIEARFGYRIKTTDYIYTTIGVGVNVKDSNPEYRILFSVNFTTPHEKKKIKKIFEEEQ